MLKRAFWLLLLASGVGCSTETRTYTVSVRNELSRPVTIALTKTSGPFEANWASPEDVAARRVTPDQAAGMRIVEPGKTASVNDVSGQFANGGKAVLRVYAGDLDFKQMLDTKPGANRVDVTLTPGRNELTVRESNGALQVQPVNK